MRNVVTVLAVIVAAAIGLWALFGGDDTDAPARPAAETPERAPEPATPRRLTAAPDDTAPRPSPTRQRAAEIRLDGPRTAAPSTDERRPGERSDHYAKRMAWRDAFERFTREAELTADERARLIEALADAQEQSILSWQAFHAAIDAGDTQNLPSLAQMGKQIEDQLAEDLGRFLSPDELAAFQRSAHLSTVIGYGKWQPLDIRRGEPGD